jgi:beta-glucanase (GH16 family)/Ca2+-binding RTX toxin-like protein
MPPAFLGGFQDVTYYNYLGQPMPETATEQSNILGTPAGGETIQAPAGNSSIAGDGGGDVLVGSSGDNTFYITDPKDRVVEQPNGGTDTEDGYMTIKLADNVENLRVHKDFNHGVGNSLDNLISTDGRAWLYGAGGNDVLVGATNTTTTFVVKAGEGSDVIYNWQGADQLQLHGTSFKTVADVRAAMTQQGSDVVLNLGGGETLTFRNTNVSTSFQDKQFLMPLDTSKLGKLTFDDEFNSLSIYDPSHMTGTWNVDYGGNLKDQSAYSLLSNNEQEVYTHDGFEGLGTHNLHLNPFSISNGALSITAQKIASQDTSAAFGHSWSSGMINTMGSFEQQYGYFEARIQVPNATGTWPAFWMVPAPYQPNEEADIMEGIGLKPDMDSRRAWGANGTSLYDDGLKLDPSGWHTYGMLWTKTGVSFYMDGVEVMHGPTPTGWNSPMAMILDLAVGGWGGNPDATQYPASMNIDYVRAYALADGSSIVQTGQPAAPYSTIQDKAQPASAPAAQSLAFDDTGAALSTGKVVLVGHDPTAADIPQSGRAFVVWESGGQVRAAEANNGYLDAPTTLMTGGISQFTGAGTFLTDGRVVVSYMGTDAGQPAAFALLYDPATHAFSTHELGPSNGQVSFTALDDGDFAASWRTSDGHVFGRAFSPYAYDSKGWWGPVRDLPGDVTGVSAQGDLIATAAGGAKTVYSVVPFALTSPDSVSIGPATVSHPEGDSGVTTYTFTVTRSDQFWERGTVAWQVTGLGDHPATGADFAGGWMPTGVLSFQGSQNTATITISVAGDGTVEPDEQFQVSLLNPVNTTLGATTVATGVIANDDTTSGSGSGSGGDGAAGQIYTSPKPGSVETGGAGADTFNASQANDTLTGGGGADVFVFKTEPWQPIHITDFQVGIDKLDLSPLFQTAGYTGSDPVADHYVYLADDGKGGTIVRFDHDASGPSPQWPNTIIDLEHVSLTGLTWTQLSSPAGTNPGGGSSGGDPGGGDTGGGGTGGDGAAGAVYTSPKPGSVETGGAGADTFNASQANDTLTGGGGADVFVFKTEPWSPIHITDFQVGVDKIDLSALFQTAGYTGSDPVADHYVYLADDGKGGTIVRFDHDASGPSPQWPNTIIDLEHVSLTGLTWAQLSSPSGTPVGGSTGGGGTGGSTGGAPGGSGGPGQVFTSPKPGSVETGGAGDDTFNASQGNDSLTGGGGADVFAFPTEPWAPIHITDFTPGTDKLDLRALMKIAGYTGSDPVGDRYIFIESDGNGGSVLRFDHDGGGPNPQWPNTIIDLEHLAPSQVKASDWIIG